MNIIMLMNSYEDVNEIKKDILHEIASIGTGNAATAMSNLLNQDVSIAIPDVKIIGFNDAIYELGSPEDIVIAVGSRMTGEMQGIMMLTFELSFANAVTQNLMDKTITDYSEVDDIVLSAITEIGNIIISSYVSSMSDFVNIDVTLSVPGSSVNMLGAVLNIPMVEIASESNKIMLISGEFSIGSQKVGASLIMVPRVESLNYLFEKLGDFCG